MRSLVSLALAGALALSALVPTALTPQVQAAEQTPEQILAKMNLDQKSGPATVDPRLRWIRQGQKWLGCH